MPTMPRIKSSGKPLPDDIAHPSAQDMYVLCPFFERFSSRRDRVKIVCEEGGYTFEDDRILVHLNTYCYDHYKECALYKGLNAKYQKLFEMDDAI